MIVVHGLVTPDGRLACWAETTEAPILQRVPTSVARATPAPSTALLAPVTPSPAIADEPAAPTDGGAPRRSHRDAPVPHPFAVLPPLPGTVTTADLLLPSTPTRPAASPELTEHLPTTRSRAQPATRRQTTWTVPIVVLPPGSDPEALLATAPDLRPGSSIGYLADVASFAASLVDRGRVLPTLTTESTPTTEADAPPDEAKSPAATRPGPRSGPLPTAAAATNTGPTSAGAADVWTVEAPTSATAATNAAAAGARTSQAPATEAAATAAAITGAVTADAPSSGAAAARDPAAGSAAGAARSRSVAGPAARWRPALWGADAATFDALCRAMPGVARAAAPWPADAATRTALDVTVDALVRARLRNRPLLTDGQVRHDTVVRAWLAALTTPDAGLRTAVTTTAAGDRPALDRADPGRTGERTEAFGAAEAFAAAGTSAVAEASGGGSSVAIPEGPEVARLREVVKRWAGSGRPAPVRTCFRLTYVEDPDDEAQAAAARDDGVWLVEFLLQPADEPGLLVPAEDVWHDAASPLFRWVDYPQDVLLADLGRASRLWPDLDDALRVPRPVSLRLDTAGAYRFLTYATLLHDAGFGVLLPAQWQRRQELGLTLTVRTRQPAAPVLRDTTANRDAIVAYRWGLAIGDEFLSEADLAELSRAKVPLVRLRGRWVHLDRERLRAGLAFLRRGGRGEMTAGEAMRLTRLVPDGDLPLPVTGVDGSGWLADLLTGRAVERLELLDEPPSLAGRLRPYQRRGLSWLAFLDSLGVGALLADDMGLGKTVQVLALEAHLRGQGPRPPTLIVCPLSVLGNWRREIERFTPGLTVRVHHGSARPGRAGTPDPADLAGADLVLTTYQVATRDVDVLAAIAWDRVVLDEAQQVKNAAGVTARAMRRLPARHRVALTGTPVENRLTELWSIADFLNPGLLGEASIFRARFSVPVERWGDADAARRLRRVTRPFLLRRVKTDRAVIADLPEKLERRQWCNLTLEQATLYRAVVDELFVKLREGRAGPQRKGLVLSAMTKLKQVCNHPAHLMGDGTPLPGRSGKLARLEEILAAALAAGDRALVFTQFARFGHMLVPHLADRLGTGVEFLHGATAKGARDRMVERFQGGDGPGVLLVSLKAGGTGLNLTAANHVVHVDRWWNPAAEAQATDRAFRIGQRRDVQVHTFVCIGTIEERVEHIMAGKRDLAGVAVGSGEGWLTGLSTDDLLDLVTLSPEAVEDA
ncbi:SNF2-related protein [Dactylosporangium sp. NPDC048998]|uniref:SNF2-related protein n=1 Tax=Dactylosporangium sp. NPDC048998 TaxID=3363976 RepID=UPI0037232D02